MNASEIVRFTATSAVSHKLRSGLTALGIAIGVAAVVLLTSMGEGLRNYMVAQFTQFGQGLHGGQVLAVVVGGVVLLAQHQHIGRAQGVQALGHRHRQVLHPWAGVGCRGRTTRQGGDSQQKARPPGR